MTVRLDTSRVDRMLETLRENGEHLDAVTADAAHDMAGSVEITAVDTGTLARSLQVRRLAEGRYQVISDVDYAPFPLYGTRYIDAQPPIIHFTSQDLAQRIHDGLFQDV